MKQLLATLASAALFGVMCMVPAVHAIEANAIGMVQGNLIQGQVFAESKAGEKRQLTASASIYEGDTIETIGEGSVVLDFKDGTRWEVYDESKLSISEYQFSDNGTGDSAIYLVHTGSLTYTGGQMGIRGSSVKIKTGGTLIYPQGTVIEFLTFLGVTVGNVVEGMARVVSTVSGAPTDDKVADEGAWFVKDATGEITVVKNKGQAQQVAQQAFKKAIVSAQSSIYAPQFTNKLSKLAARIATKTVQKGRAPIGVSDEEIGADLLGTPSEGGSETLVVPSPN